MPKTKLHSWWPPAMRAPMEKGLLGTARGKIRGSVEVPKDSRNVDYTSNFALAGAKALGMRPGIWHRFCATIWT